MLKRLNHIVYFLLFAGNMSAQQTEIKYLSGTGKDDMVNWDFYCTAGSNSGKWTSIGVPSCWELQGFGKYDYGFSKETNRGKETGMYKHEFKVPFSWKKKKVNIVFEGSMTHTEVKVNGVSAGEIHQGAFYAFKYDISRLLKYGETNLLEVTVSKQSANASVNAAERKADFWIFGGIFRPVFLEALPGIHIDQVAVDAKANGDFAANVITSKQADKLSVQLYDAAGKKVGQIFTAAVGNDSSTSLKAKFESINPWSSEFPNLYKAVFSLYKKNQLVHEVSKKVGFRTVELKQRDGIYINGVKMKFKGVNRHSFWPTSGRTTSRSISVEDVTLMKDMNMNAVRMSHYPPDAHFLDACDSMGLFVMDELAGWHGQYDTETGTKLVREMILHDVNHPSIVMWSNGNEGGHNFELDHLFNDLDVQQRPVIHPWQLFNGVETQHYREYDYGIGNYDHGHEIVMPTEFLHGLYDGGHGAGLEDYWNAMLKNPLSAGGFLWDFADQGVVRKDKKDSIDTDGNHGADGIVGPYHEKEGSYFAIKEIWSPVYIEPKEITGEFNGKLNVENRYSFTNLDQCSFKWELIKFESPLVAHHNIAYGKPGKGTFQSIIPSSKGQLEIKLPVDWASYDMLTVKVTDPHHQEIYEKGFRISLPAKWAGTLVSKKANGSVSIVQNDSDYVVMTRNVQVWVNKTNGMLKRVSNETGIIPFNNGPVIQEAANNFNNFSQRVEDSCVIIESTFDRKTGFNTLQWTFYPSGWIKMKLKYFPAEYFTSFLGANFSFPEKEIRSVELMANGPYRVWKNRMKGNNLGIWTKPYNNTETGESWNYPEFKGYYSNLYWCRFNTTAQKFLVVTENEDVFLRLFTPAWKTDQWHNYEPIFPTGDISFMQGIPSIGTKTQRNETTGPMGSKNIFYDYEKDPSRALSMVLYFNFNQ